MEIQTIAAIVVVLSLIALAGVLKIIERRRRKPEPEPDFTIVDWTRAELDIPVRPPRPTIARDGFQARKEINLTARCHFTGKEVRSCTCSRHLQKR